MTQVLAGRVPIGASVTLRGWVRTRRDSKAGLSFIHLHDGSCFDPIQVVQGNLIDVGPCVSQRIIEAQGGRLDAKQGRGDVSFTASLAAARA